MAPPPPPTVDYSRPRAAERPVGSRYVDYLEQFARRMRKASPEGAAAADAAGGGGGSLRAGPAAATTGGGRYGFSASVGIATAMIRRPPDAYARARRPVARYYPDRSWAGAAPWSSWEERREGEGGRWTGATATATTTTTKPLAATSSALSGAGALLLPLPAEALIPRRPGSAPLPPGGMLLWGGGGGGSTFLGGGRALAATATTATATATTATTPRRAKHRPTTTPDLESGAAVRDLLRREPPLPGEPAGSWACWPATLRALPLRPTSSANANTTITIDHDSILRHRYSDPWDKPPQRAPLCVDRAPSPCTTARPDPSAARDAYASALEGYRSNKLRAVLGAPAARRYARPEVVVAATGFGDSSLPLLPARVRGPTGAARPASPEGSRWAEAAAATSAAAVANKQGSADDGVVSSSASFFEGEAAAA
jgi:hypothetical protein